jgi:DNA (cytosine-5)-methyltransferase 1
MDKEGRSAAEDSTEPGLGASNCKEPAARGRVYAAVSMFSGCGGMDLGAEWTGKVRVVYAVDNDHWAVETYRRNLGSHVIEADVRTTNPAGVPCDILLAGPPCQDFSTLWNHDGLKGKRGDLFQEVARYLAVLRPPAFVMENVLGLLSANRGQAWTQVRRALRAPAQFLGQAEGPRYLLRVECIDMADLGVPQNRERIIIIGVRADVGIAPPAVPLPYKDRHTTVREVLDHIPMPPPGEANHDVGFDSPEVVERLKLIPPGKNYEVIPRDHPLAVKGLISHVYKRLDPNRPAYTIIASGGGGSHGYHHIEPRRLSNRERARLQSFPDDFIFAGPPGRDKAFEYVAVRRQIGNAIPPLGAKIIIGAVTDALTGAGIRGYTKEQIERARLKASRLSRREAAHEAHE